MVPGQRAVLVRNDQYWDKNRLPKVARMELLPIPDHNTRAAALLSGQVHTIQAPPPDIIPRLQSAGMQIVRNEYPHIWPYILRVAGDATPFTDLRVRQAINLAIIREGLVKLLGGNAKPATGLMLPSSPWYGQPSFKIRYSPDEAKKLLQEAGYGPGNPLKFTALISPGGSGQMQPLPMNEFIQQNLKAIGVELSFKVVEWQTLRTIRNKGPLDPSNVEIHGVNNSWETSNPATGMEALFASWKLSPKGVNWGVQDPEIDALIFRRSSSPSTGRSKTSDAQSAPDGRRQGLLALRGLRHQRARAVASREGVQARDQLESRLHADLGPVVTGKGRTSTRPPYRSGKGRPPLVPVGRALEGVRDAYYARLIEGPPPTSWKASGSPLSSKPQAGSSPGMR